MYRSIDGDKSLWDISGKAPLFSPPLPQGNFSVPQDTGSIEQTFMMYSRPSSFGPPQRLHLSGTAGTVFDLKFTNWAESEPADYRTGEDFAVINLRLDNSIQHMKSVGMWDDIPPTNKFNKIKRVIFEWDIDFKIPQKL